MKDVPIIITIIVFFLLQTLLISAINSDPVLNDLNSNALNQTNYTDIPLNLTDTGTEANVFNAGFTIWDTLRQMFSFKITTTGLPSLIVIILNLINWICVFLLFLIGLRNLRGTSN